MFKDVVERNIREYFDIESRQMDLEKKLKATSTIDIIKEKSDAGKKLEEEIVDITTDDSLLEEMVNEGMTFEIYCQKQLTILVKIRSRRKLIKNTEINHETSNYLN